MPRPAACHSHAPLPPLSSEGATMYTTICFKGVKTNAKGTAPLVLRITIEGQRADHSTGYRVSRADWNAKKGAVRGSHPAANTINEQLQKLLGDAVTAKQRIEAAAARVLPQRPGSPATAREVAEYLRDPAALLAAAAPPDFLAYCEAELEAYYAPRNYGTYKSVRQAVRALRAWHGARPLRLDAFAASQAQDFYEYLLRTSRSRDPQAAAATAAQKLCWLTALFRRGQRLNRLGAMVHNPFAEAMKSAQKARTGKPRPKPRLTAAQLQLLAALPLRRGSPRDVARNVYLLQFYLRGERIGATLLLRRADYCPATGQLKWQAQKRGPLKQAAVPEPARQLLAGFAAREGSPFLLPLLPPDFDRLSPRLQLSRINYAIRRLNLALVEVWQLAGFEAGLRTHSARHSFATLAYKATDYNPRKVQLALGHGALRTTEVYLAELTGQEMQVLQDDIYEAIF